MSFLESEVSARVARAFCGLTSEDYERAFAEKPAVKAVFDAIRGGSLISQAAQEAFATEVRKLSETVYEYYADIWSTAGIEIGALNEGFNTTKALEMFFALTKASLPDRPTIEGRGSVGAEADVSSGRRVGGR